jgi:hypothetical protein
MTNDRTHTRSRRHSTLLIALATLSAVQSAAAESPAGIFVEDPQANAETKLEVTLTMDYEAQGIAKSVFTGGLAKPKLVWTYSGARAEPRLAAQPAFRFRFDAKPAANPQDPAAMMAMMLGGGPPLPAGAKSPADFMLLLLEVDGEARQVITTTSRTGASNPKNPSVALDVEKVASHDFRVRARQPLAAGEYAFFYKGSDGQGRIWAFGVD